MKKKERRKKGEKRGKGEKREKERERERKREKRRKKKKRDFLLYKAPWFQSLGQSRERRASGEARSE